MDGFSERYRKLGFLFLCLAVVGGAIYILTPFLPAILWATILSVLMYPFYARCRKRMNENLSATATTVCTLLLIGLPLAGVGTALFFQVDAFAKELEQAAASAPGTRTGPALTVESVFKRADEVVKPIANRLGAQDFSVQRTFENNRKDIVTGLTGPLTRAARDTVFTLLTLVVAFLTMFFMVRDAHRLRQPALELIPLPREQSQLVLDKLQNTIFAVFYGVVLVAVLQGFLATAMYAVAGIPNWLMWGVATTILCAIPLLGSPLIYIPMALVKISQGELWVGIGMLAFGFLIISQIDNLIRPFVIGARTSFHPMAVFFSLLGGVLAMGPAGIMAGPMILAILLAIIDVIRMRMSDPSLAPPDPESGEPIASPT